MKKELLLKKPLSDKLLSYSAAAAAVMAIGQTAEAQMEYTDIEPDTTVAGDEGFAANFELDINNDGTADLLLRHANETWYSGWQSVTVMPFKDAAIVASMIHYACGTFDSSYAMGLKFESQDIIGPAVNSFGSSYYTFLLGWARNSCTSGQFKDAEDKFLGVRFSLDGGTTHHYGWVRLDVASGFSSFTVKDYAFELTADKEIAAGLQNPLSIRNSVLNNASVNVFSYGNKVVIDANSDFSAEAEIINTIGQMISKTQIRGGRTELQVEQKGIYVVRLSVDNETLNQKVIIQ